MWYFIAFVVGACLGALVMGIVAGGTRNKQPKP